MLKTYQESAPRASDEDLMADHVPKGGSPMSFAHQKRLTNGSHD